MASSFAQHQLPTVVRRWEQRGEDGKAYALPPPATLSGRRVDVLVEKMRSTRQLSMDGCGAEELSASRGSELPFHCVVLSPSARSKREGACMLFGVTVIPTQTPSSASPAQAVASPRLLLDESRGDFAFGASPKESNNNNNSLFSSSGDFAPGFRFISSARHYDCKPYSGFGDGHDDEDVDDVDDEDQSCDGSEEFFPEPDPFDPADGGLPCLSRRPLGARGPTVPRE